MKPLHFGPPARRLFGIHHPPPDARAAKGADLMCGPFGQEAIRTHRMLRVLAERMARNGFHVLRFDYFATGESPGSDTDGDLLGWVGDVLAAHEELQQRAAAPQRVVWLGVRLGGTVACLASDRTPRPPDKLVLWEPIVDGTSYLQFLADKHLEALSENYGSRPVPTAMLPQQLDPRGLTEAIGFEVSARLRQQLLHLALPSLAWARAGQISLVAQPGQDGAAELGALLGSKGGQVELKAFAHDFDWTSEEALNTSLVPPQALQMLANELES